MKRISEAQVIRLHSQLIKATGGLDGVRDNNLLSSALSSPFQFFGEYELYSTHQEKAARLAFNLIKNHIFLDGNKRIGILIMLVFLEINGLAINASDQELIVLGLDIASGNMLYEEIVEWVLLHENNVCGS